MTLWSHVLVSCFEESSYSQLPGSLSSDYKYLHTRHILKQLSFPSESITDKIRYIIGVFCLTLNHRQVFLLLIQHTSQC